MQILIDRPLQREFAKEDEFGQTLVLMNLTNRSANAFRFGLRGGSRIGSTPLE